MGAIYWSQEDQEAVGLCYVFNKIRHCVPATVVEWGEQGGMVPTLTQHTRSQAPRGGDLPRSHSELGKGWSPEPLPTPSPRMGGFRT